MFKKLSIRAIAKDSIEKFEKPKKICNLGEDHFDENAN